MQKLIVFAALICLSCGNVAAKAAISSVKANLTGDGSLDTVSLVQRSHQISISVHLAGTHSKPQVLVFGVNGGVQDAVCGLPVKLKVVPLSCSADGSALPGCIDRKGAQGLLLSDDQCDPIYLYWDHRAKRLAWWRN